MKLSWKKILLIFILWRLGLFLIAILAPNFFTYQASYPYPELLKSYNLANFINRWAGFDGIHYLSIVERGYKEIDLIQAFFPIYPILTSFLGLLSNNSLLNLLIISNLSTVNLASQKYSWP
jgi:hypothetical protein